ncbi:MAG: Asp23/Gls24 family envelope stress response protein [Pseudonocardiaceae bacterium]
MTTTDDRGTLEVNPSVVRKVAQWAADLTPGTLRAPRRVAGIGAGEHGSTAKVDGAGNDIDITLDVALRYPSPVREITDQVRRQVTDEVRRITGYRVRAVRVTVSALLPETRPRVE